MHIVVVDDDEMLVRTLQRRLEQAGHQITGVTALADPSQLIARPADVYLLDLRFGQQSGLQFIAPLRQAYPHCRILLMTGFASIATAVQAVKLGADDYLTKPIDFRTLLSALLGEISLAESKADDDNEVLSTDQLEWEHIQRILQEQDGNISQTARLLGMHRRTLQRKLNKHRP